MADLSFADKQNLENFLEMKSGYVIFNAKSLLYNFRGSVFQQ